MLLAPGIFLAPGVIVVMLIAATLSMPTTVYAQASGIIQKCQDTSGKWHYGNQLNAGCRSSISSLNPQGVTIRKSNPFRPTSGIQQLAIKQQHIADQRLLHRYSSIISIEQEKLRKITELEKQQNINMEMIDEMGGDITQLVSLNSQVTRAAMQEKQSAIRMYQSRYKTLSQKIHQISSNYEELTSDYLQAKARAE